jgi:cysteine desulfurase/selenocysteine lyase
MRPFLGGGDMIREVTRDTVTWNDPPMKFEAGTPGIVQQIGLGVALDYLMSLGMQNVAAHERTLRDYAHDISTILDKRGIAVRAGTHCAMPLMEHMGITASCRASFGLYNTTEEVDALVSALELAHELFA